MSKKLVNFLENDTEVARRLGDLQLNRSQVEEVMKRAINAKLSAVLNHPQNASGTLAYIEGVRAMRDVIGDGKSWKRTPDKGIEYIENSVQKIRMVFQNVDYACDPTHDPQPISKKGEGSKKAVSSNQMTLFGLSALIASPSVWFLCVS